MRNRLIKIVLIFFLLMFGYFSWVVYPYFVSKINNFDSLGALSLVDEQTVPTQSTYNPNRVTDRLDNHLLQGEKLTATVRATENNFGIWLFKFAKLASIVSDTVIFRIKKEGDENWYYENKYKADQFQDNQYFTFGFPPISDSKDKSFVFEIESTSGTYKYGIGISLDDPKVALVYGYSKSDLENSDV